MITLCFCYRFPSDPFRKIKWIRAIRRERNDQDWAPSQFSVICNRHFEERDFHRTKLGHKRLNKTAFPSLFQTIVSKT